MMDLTNLSLDELLAQIKGDSGYIAATQSEPSQPAEKALSESVPEVEDVTSVEPVLPEEPVEEEPVVYSAEPLVAEPEIQVAVEEPVIEEQAVYEPELPAVDEAVFHSFLSVEDEAVEPEEQVNNETVRNDYNFEKTQRVEIIEELQEEPVSLFDPKPFEYIPAVPEQTEHIDLAEEPFDGGRTAVYTPVVIADLDKEFDEDKAEGFSLFGNIDIDSDVSSMFPEVQEELQPQDMQKTAVFGRVPDKTVIFERPGIVTVKSAFEKTGDLSAIPAILSADEVLKDKYASGEKTFVRTGSIPIVGQPKQQPALHDDGQMVLPGFDVPEEPVAQVDESAVEDELRKNRSKKVDSFRLEGVLPDEPVLDRNIAEELSSDVKKRRKRFSAVKTRTRLNRQGVEYNRPSDKARVIGFISRKRLTAFIGAVVSGICTLVLLVTTAIPQVTEIINEMSDTFSVPALLAFVLVSVAFAAVLPSCVSGITTFFSGSGRPNAQTPVFFAALAALIQSLILLIFDMHGELPLFACAAAFVLCLCAVGRLMAYGVVGKNFEFLAFGMKDGLYAVRTVEDASDANRIGHNVVMGDADIRYSSKTRFASNFFAYSFASDAADDLCIKLVPITAVASVVIGVIAGIMTKDVLYGFSLFVGAMCMGVPASAVIAVNLPLSTVNKKLRADGGIITGYAGAFEYESTNAVAIDAQDLFPGSSCNIHGMKTFYGVRIDDAILTAASMILAAGGPISSLFNEVVMGRKELLMNVDDLVYEDRLGLSGWVRDRKVFVGNRKLLENHNIEIPMSIDEAKYRRDGRRVIYLADAGKIAAIFVVSYGSDPRISEHLRRIENSGINILIRTTDSNITEEFVANCFGLPLNSVKIVSSNAAEVLSSYAQTVTPKADAKLLHNGSLAAFLHCISKANSLCSIAGIIATQQIFCSAAGLLLLGIIVLMSGALNVTALQICICQLVWLAIGIIVPMINRE